MSNCNTNFGKTVFEIEPKLAMSLIEVAQSLGYTSMNDYFEYLVEEHVKNALKDLSVEQIDAIVKDIIEGILDDESWETGESHFRHKPFTFVYAYKTLKSVDSNFSYPNWDQISKSSRNILGRTFKKHVLLQAQTVQENKFYINLKDELLSNAALYEVRKKTPSNFGKK